VIAAIASAPFKTGAVGWVAMGMLALAALGRAHRAIWRNERYWFTTWRWGVLIAALIVVGMAIRLGA
jgi:hypothetical protein